MSWPRLRLAVLAGAMALATSSGWPATAAPPTDAPAPTVAVTVATPPEGHATPYPGDPASWTVARPGRDATLSFRLATATESDLVAIWTSTPRRPTSSRPAATLTVGRTYVQADPSEDGDLLQVQARWRTSTRSPWSAWTTPVSTWLGMGVNRGSPQGQGGTATYTVPYPASRATSPLTLQLRFILAADRAGYLESSLRVTA